MTPIKTLLKNSLLFILYILGFINPLIPKKERILFFTNNSNFNDNNKALLAQLIEKNYLSKYEIIYCSKDHKKYAFYKGVKYRSTLFAPLYFLRSRFCFYDAGTVKIKPTKSQQVISLWHGVPLKKIGALVGEKSSFLDKYNDFTKILVPNPSLAPIYMDSFECKEEQILINGFPRNDFLFKQKIESLEKLDISLTFKKHLLWMPTFRKSISGRYNDANISNKNWDLPIFSSPQDLTNLNLFLQENDSLLVIKLHPYSIFNRIKSEFIFSNITFISNADINEKNIINYELVSQFDCLITDYSSVFFDYLLVDKPLAFTMNDIADYQNNRGFTVDNPEDYLVGDKIITQEDFYAFILKINTGVDDFVDIRNSLKNNIHQFTDDQSTSRLIKYLQL